MKKILTLVLAGFLLAGCSNKTQEAPAKDLSQDQAPIKAEERVEEKQEDQTPPAKETKTKESFSSAEDLDLSPRDAVEIFKSEFPDAVLTSVELDREDRGWIYEIHGHSSSKEYDLKIDAQTKEILHREVENDDDDEDDEEVNIESALSLAEVYEIAKKEGLGDIDYIKLDNDDGRQYIDVEDTSDKEIEIDAKTGQVYEKDF